MHEHKGGALTETTLLILLSLSEVNHGYGMMQYVKEATGGRVVLGAGTLYGALSTLEKKGWIEGIATPQEDRKKEYGITEEGKRQLRQEQIRLQSLLALMKDLEV